MAKGGKGGRVSATMGKSKKHGKSGGAKEHIPTSKKGKGKKMKESKHHMGRK